MSDDNAKRLIKDGDDLFKKRGSLLSLWQEIALNFYPERADFTITRSIGDEFADHLMNSYPVLARRDLGNSFSSMLRRDDWFKMGVKSANIDGEGKSWLEWATKVQYKAMYDIVTGFKRATKEGDHDFASFGQCAITRDLNINRDALLYRCWHLRDLAWCEGPDGMIDTVHHKWNPSARELVRMFPKTVDSKIREKAKKDPYSTVACRRVVLPSEYYESYGEPVKRRMPFVSVYIECENEVTLQETGQRSMPYVIPRWQTVSGSQYAYSPSTIVALPDARLIQAMTLVLLEAGEKSANPPMVATSDVIRSDVDLRAGGVTWVDAEYDERLGDALRPLTVDRHGLPGAMEMSLSTRGLIMESFYLNKLTLPLAAGDMTATEVSQRVQEYIRQALPLFEPMEESYNGALCESTFQLLMENGAFGSPESIPRSLRGQEIEFKFISPLRAAVEREKGTRFGEMITMVGAAQPIDPTIVANIDINYSLRDALEGVGVPARWIRDEDDTEEARMRIEQEQRLQQMAVAAEAAGKAAPAVEALREQG